MASMDKLVKALEALKLALTPSSAEEKQARHKVTLSLCQTVTDYLCSSEVRAAPNFANLLVFSIETLLQLCDDEDSDVRMMADECLNRIIRSNMSTMHNSILKIHVELHKEMKKNGKPRSLRAALTRFAQLAHMIRPQKGKVYMQSLTPCLINVARRQDESILETLAASVPKIFSALGPFASDTQIKSLLETLLENVASENAVVRRSSSDCILHVCVSIPKSQVFLAFVLSLLLDLVVPLREDLSSCTILGVLYCVRGLLPHINYQGKQSVIRGSFGTKRKQSSQAVPSMDYIVQIFELCLEWSRCSSDHNVVATSLETLHQVLSSAPSGLVALLVSSQGLIRSRIHPQQHPHHPRLTTRSLSEMSLTSSVGGGDESLMVELDDSLPISLSTWSSDQHVDKSHSIRWSSAEQPNMSRPSSATPSTSNLSLDSVVHDQTVPSILEDSTMDGGSGCSTLTSCRQDVDKAISPEPPDIVDSLSAPCSPHSSIAHVDKRWDIGDLFDGESSAIVYTGRFLASRFLLCSGSVRVSIRCLAVSCLTQLIRIQPSVLFTSLERCFVPSTLTDADRVSDVLMLADHPDPQLRGLVRVLCGQLLSSTLQVCSLPSDNVLSAIPRISHLLLQGLYDDCLVCVCHSLTGVSLFVKELLHSDYHALSHPLLEMLIKTSLNPYWLVKVKLLEVVSELPLTTVAYSMGDCSYQQKLISSIFLPALGDSDSRVRKAAASSFVSLVRNLYFPGDHEQGDVIAAHGKNVTERVLLADPSRANELLAKKIRNNLSRIVYFLTQAMMESSSKYTVFGCIETLCNLSTVYRVTDYPCSWQCSITPSSTSNSISNGGLLSMLATLLTESSLSLDLEVHTLLLTLAGNIFMALSQSFLRYADNVFDPSSLWPNIKDPKVCSDGEALLQHVLRLLSMFVILIDDSPKISGVSPLKRRPSTAHSPPSKNPQSPFLDKEKKEEKNWSVGQMQSASPAHYVKLFELIKSAYNNYRVTLEQGSSEKFLKLVSSVLGCMCNLLCAATVTSTCFLTEEALCYLRVTFVLDPTHTVQVVNQLLKCLFVRKEVTKEAIEPGGINEESGLSDTLIGRPLKNLSKLLETSHPVPQCEKEGERLEKRQQQSCVITLDRKALAGHIKLFEPIVIQALKEYTVTSDVHLQVEVLKLLMQLVQLKVNYCLLDSEQIFFKFVLKQFDFLETGQIKKAELLIPEIFNFLLHLSNEKNHSKPVISIPRVIQLCDGLMACGQDPLTHCIPALTPLVEHVFVSAAATATCEAKELDTQREVILAMLLKLAEYPQVVGLLNGVMSCSSWQTDQWKRLYSQTVDTLVAAMTRASIRLDQVQTLFSLLNSGPAPHLPHLLTLLFVPQAEGQATDEWLGGIAAVLMSVSNCKEESIFLQLDQMKLYIQEEGDDPLNVNTKSKQVQPQRLMAKLLLKVIRNVSAEMEAVESSNVCRSSCELLYTHFSDFMYTVIRMAQPGNFEQVMKCLMELIKSCYEVEEITRSLSKIHRRNPLPLILWSYLLALLDFGSRQMWDLIINQPQDALSEKLSESCRNIIEVKKRSMDSELVRRSTILLYCEYILVNDAGEKQSDLDWLLGLYVRDLVRNCYEPSVHNMLRRLYLNQTLSKLLLDHLSKCIVLDQAGFSYQLLHCLEFINPSYTGLVLELIAISLVQHTSISIARLAVSFCSRTLEYLLTLEQDQITNQLSKLQITALMNLFSSNEKLSKRGSVVTSLLNKLAYHVYGLGATCEDNVCNVMKTIDIAHVQSTALDSLWLASLVKDKCWSTDDSESKHYAALLLNKLSEEQIKEIISSPKFNLSILQYCFHLHSPGASCSEAASVESTSRPNLFSIAHHLLLDKLASLQHKKVGGTVDTNDVMILVPAVSNYLISISSTKTTIDNFPTDSQKLFYTFALLIAQAIDKSLTKDSEAKIISKSTQISIVIECLARILNLSFVTSLLEYGDICFICNVLFAIIKYLTHLDVPLKTLKSSSDNMSEADVKFGRTCLKMASLICWLEARSDSSKLIPTSIYSSIRKVILRLSVSSKVLYYCRIPVEAWPAPLKSDTIPPPVDINLLHDVSLLRHLTDRISLLRWRSRQEFEETWVCLLSALLPTLDSATHQHHDLFTVTQLNRLVVDGVSWLVLTTLKLHSSNGDRQCYLHVPRLSSEPICSHSRWPRLKELNDLILSKYKLMCHRLALNLSRVDLMPNIERPDQTDYGIGQLSVEYLQYQMLTPEERTDPPKSEIQKVLLEREKRLEESGLDIRSCVQFLLDLFSQWALPDSGVSDSVNVTVIRSTLCLSDLFTDKNHYLWMMDRFLKVSKIHPSFDVVVHQYLTIGVCKAAAVLVIQDEEECEKVYKVLENAVRSEFTPLRTAGVQGLLYLLQVVQPSKVDGRIDNKSENDRAADGPVVPQLQLPTPSPLDYSNKIISLAVEHINKHFVSSLEKEEEEDCLLVVSLVVYVLERYPEAAGYDVMAVVKSLTQLIKNPPSHSIYYAAVKGVERLILVSNRPDIFDPLSRLALERLSHSDPLITLPALQLLLASVYSEVDKTEEDSSPEKMTWTMEKMETASLLFDRIKKGYLIEVELIVEVVAKVLSDLFPASDILTKVIGEFLSPNQPHKKHLARIVLQCFSQACQEDQLSLLQDWVVHFLNNFSANLPTAGWCLCCFFISASTNANLKAIFPLVQSRITKCHVEDRKILCLAALDFYRQLTSKQQEMFLATIRDTAHNQKGPFSDIIACL